MDSRKKATRIYGLTFMRDTNQTDTKKDSKPFYKINAYFTTREEINKVVADLNLLHDGRIYTSYETTNEQVEFKITLLMQDKGLKNTKSELYQQLINYKIYDSAEEYFDELNAMQDEPEK